MSDAIRRGIRSFVVDTIRTFLMLITLPQFVDTIGGQPVPKFATLLTVVVAAVWAGVLGLLTFILNALEDKGTIPALLKARASSGAHPITHDPAK